jgi:hypothetical protein
VPPEVGLPSAAISKVEASWTECASSAAVFPILMVCLPVFVAVVARGQVGRAA